MKMFAGQTTMNVLSRLGMKEGDAIEHPMLSKSVERAQRKVEERNFQIRKNILEYDEVMEAQRQEFYGLRQRVLEGREVKGLILEYIDECIDDACAEYLSASYPAKCAIEYVREELDTEVMLERLKGRDADEMDKRAREDAKAEARSMIDVTLGEYMSAEGAEVAVDFDAAGLARWAKSRFGVDISPDELSEGDVSTRRDVQDKLVEAAEAQIDEADLGRLDVFVAEDYGIEQLIAWAKRMFDVEMTLGEVKSSLDDSTPPPEAFLRERVRERYQQKEINYPIDFALQMTMMSMRQSPQEALEQLLRWTKTRFGVELDADEVRTGGPAKMKQKLTDIATRWWEIGEIDAAREEFGKAKDYEELKAISKSKYDAEPPEWLRWLDEAEFKQAARGLVDQRLRPELTQLEMTILLDTFDQSWKDHLYSMDQLRDGINYQAFAQQDPRIAFKKQGSKQFNEMLDDVQERVAEYIFKARLNVGPAAGPGQMPPQGPRQQPPAARPPAAAPNAGGLFSTSIVGSGLGDGTATPGPRPAPGSGGQPPAG